ncbi:hypothetical protein SMC26_07170 [Actinomadura fulvescens]|uniref:hypothetical protein n=1 Tax=Actinomadura fulvescens TaxID=46160 RepID=UPI0031DCF058
MSRKSTMEDVPRWADLAARLVPLTVLPTVLWQSAMGFTDGPSWMLTPYVLVLSLVVELLAFLTLGLVRPWGEVFPRWIPFAGGRNVPTLFAVSVASLGAVAVTFAGAVGALGWADAPQGITMTLCYLPFLAWGPLLAIVTVHYLLRRTRGGHSISESLAGSKPTGNGSSVENDSPAFTFRTMR